VAHISSICRTSVERAACLFNFPGAAYAKAFGFLSPECGFFSFFGRCGRLLWVSAMLLIRPELAAGNGRRVL